MSRPTRDAIQSYMNITGAFESIAIQRLEEHGGNLAEAVNAHFRGMERDIVNPTSSPYSDHSIVEENRQVESRDSRPGGLASLFSAARAFRPSLLLDNSYSRNILRQIGGSAFGAQPSPAPHAGEVTGYPAAYPTWGNNQIRPSGHGEVDDYARTSSTHGSHFSGETQRDDAEEEMIRAAIEASKKDVKENLSNVLAPDEVIKREDEDLARAISLSLETEDIEGALREQIAELQPHPVEGYGPSESGTNSNSRYKPGSSSGQDRLKDIKLKQPIENSACHEHHLQHIEASPNPKEWGGIPSKELQEALLLEKAFFQSGHHTEGPPVDNMILREEPQRSSTVKESLPPKEPSPDNEHAIDLLIRMPDSSRYGRRFLKSDKLKYLFDFIDAGGAVKPATYRVVRPYPRHAFSLEDSESSFEQLGLTNKQETLFLELI